MPYPQSRNAPQASALPQATLPPTPDPDIKFLELLKIYKDQSGILPFTPSEVCRTSNQDRKILTRVLQKAVKQDLLPVEIEILARISLDFNLDRALLSPHNIGSLNSASVQEKQIEVIKKTTHRGIARYKLDDHNLYDALKLQDKTISSKMLAESVKSFPENQRELALQILAIGSSFSSIHSLFQLATHPELNFTKIYRVGQGSICESLKYLQKKSPSNVPLKFTTKLEFDSRIILDQIAIDKIASDPTLQNEIITRRVQLILPVGLENGISVFGKEKLDKDTITQKISQLIEAVLKKTKDHPNQEIDSHTLKTLVAETIAQPTLQKLPDKLRDNIILATGENTNSVAELASNLAGPKHITNVEQVASLMLNIPGSKEEIDLLRDYLIRNINYFSNLKIAESFKRLEQNLSQIREDREIVFYLPTVPNSNEAKSYHLMINLYIRSAGIENAKIVEGPERLKDISRDIVRGKHPDSQLILIDDFAGTGASLYNEYKAIRSFYKGQLAICCLATTDKAIALMPHEEPFSPDFRGFAFIETTDPNFYFSPCEVVSKFGPKSLRHYSSEEQMILYTMAGTLGYGNIGTCAILPYMAPNNNISAIEPFSICLTNNCGVKNTTRCGKAS